MNDDIDAIIGKAKIVKEMAQSHEVKQVCNLLIDLADSMKEKKMLGFGSESKRPDRPKNGNARTAT